MDGGAARRLVNELLSQTADTAEIEPAPDAVAELLGLFKIRISDEPASGKETVHVRIHQDPLFGPLVLAERPDGRRILRITPLTNTDVEEALTSLGLAGESGLGLLLAHLSQMIEELPWLWSLEGHATADAGAALLRPVALTLRSPAAGSPRVTY